MGNKITDQQLVERVQNGDKKAFDLLVMKYQQRIVNLVSRFVRNQADALDVTQDAFIKAYRALPNFRGDSAFYTWMYRIAVNTAKNHLAVQNRRPMDIDQDVSEIEQIEGDHALKEYATPEHMLLRDEIEDTIIQAIEGLPEDLRIAITLREIEGLSYEDIAEAMECPIGTVRSRIFRAREGIDKELKPLLDK
ncbi:MAG: RNA polymerase sigma factor RpoE [Gammaproteobacteria bacterium]|nr:RNA polymerase sigma factor RpoE [Gammaproteobacteria bacterium]NIN62057.1 RNA polymerase sigma factor RpoE [Gammaproteobacteria bacterium]NIO62136.1 RNA polymerase sigma factor RpoE [Gammaproteobacteria bacterium]NIQ08254.1 RNA polymerase sigma factor RpoE [Gammaproteobacteria bacterium]NIQ19848.1 RNA polymerase sigma factor RpoE [Gammaproteobacteria bacterium]